MKIGKSPRRSSSAPPQLKVCKQMLYICRTIVIWYFPKGIFPRETFQVTISQMPTSQMCNFPSSNSSQRLGIRPSEAPQAAVGAECCSQDVLVGRAPQLGQTWEVAAWEIAHLERYPWEGDTWEKSFGKVPNIKQ